MLAIMGVIGLAAAFIFGLICCVLLFFQRDNFETLIEWQSARLVHAFNHAEPLRGAPFAPGTTAAHSPFLVVTDKTGGVIVREGDAPDALLQAPAAFALNRFHESQMRVFYAQRLADGGVLTYGMSVLPVYKEVLSRMAWVVVAGVAGIAAVLAVIYGLLIRYTLSPLVRFFERYHDRAVRGITKQESMNGDGVIGEEGVHPRILRQINRVLELTNLLVKKSILFESFTQKAAMETEKAAIYHHLYKTVRALFPVENISVLELNHSANRMEVVFQHPKAVYPPQSDMVEPAACIAFRYGDDVVHDRESCGCAYFCSGTCSQAICTPMFAQGSIVGVCRIDLDLKTLGEGVFYRKDSGEYLENIRTFLAPFVKYTGVAIGNINITNIYKNQAITDALTGLYNRRYLVEAFVNNLEVAKRRESPVGCFILDIDNFKRFNDEFGHKVGDLVLKRVAKTLQGAIRSGDIAGRFGGEEFLVILPDTPDAEVYRVAERVRTAIAAINYDEIGLNNIPKITVSIGIAAFPMHGYSHYHITHAADQALYRAKNEGKNRSIVHHDPTASGGD